MEQNRLKLEDSTFDVVVKMAEGNPGAVNVLAQLINKEEGLGLVQCCKLDDYGIYGCRIWMCYKDLCGQDIDRLYNLLKDNKLKDAIRDKQDQDEMFEKEWAYYNQT